MTNLAGNLPAILPINAPPMTIAPPSSTSLSPPSRGGSSPPEELEYRSTQAWSARGVRIICDGTDILGDFSSGIHGSVAIRPSDLLGDAPAVRARGLAVMGGVSVATRARG